MRHPYYFKYVLIGAWLFLGLLKSIHAKHQTNTQHKLNSLIRESYNEVSAHILSHFNYKCNLALQNCLFLTQWEKVFGKDKIAVKPKNEIVSSVKRKKRHLTTNINRFRPARSTIDASYLNFSNASFYYCHAFLVGRFCIDDYLKKSADDIQCTNGTHGNSPIDFKRSIYRTECKDYYAYFFESSSLGIRHLFNSRLLFFLKMLACFFTVNAVSK